jgi:hypothetical protein
MRTTKRYCLLAAGALTCWVALGCSPPTGEVTGQVLYKKKPVPSGSVVFVGSDGKRHTCVIRADQTYQVKDLPPGPARIAVVTHALVPPAFETSSGKRIPPTTPDAGNGPPPSVRIAIPSKYGSVETSGLSYPVRAGRHSHDIVIPDTP